MPEGDTVWRTARRLHEVFAGRVITRCELRWASLARYDLTGATTIEVVSHGKHLLHRLEWHDQPWTIHSHLRMDGSWIIEMPSANVRSHRIRALLATSQYLAIGHDLGMLDVVPTGDEVKLTGHLGPDLLGADWDAQMVVRNLRASDQVIAAALLDQRNLAGIGTIWAAETLFAMRLNPWTLTSELTDDQLMRIVVRAQAFLQNSRAQAIPSSTGEFRSGRATYVHGRHRQNCRRCGARIKVAMAGPATQERTIFYCPSCQGVDDPALP